MLNEAPRTGGRPPPIDKPQRGKQSPAPSADASSAVGRNSPASAPVMPSVPRPVRQGNGSGVAGRSFGAHASPPRRRLVSSQRAGGAARWTGSTHTRR